MSLDKLHDFSPDAYAKNYVASRCATSRRTQRLACAPCRHVRRPAAVRLMDTFFQSVGFSAGVCVCVIIGIIAALAFRECAIYSDRSLCRFLRVGIILFAHSVEHTRTDTIMPTSQPAQHSNVHCQNAMAHTHTHTHNRGAPKVGDSINEINTQWVFKRVCIFSARISFVRPFVIRIVVRMQTHACRTKVHTARVTSACSTCVRACVCVPFVHCMLSGPTSSINS